MGTKGFWKGAFRYSLWGTGRRRVAIRFLLISTGMTLLMGITIGVLFWTAMGWRFPEWKDHTDHVFFELDSVSAPRGNIYAESGELLVTSIPVFSVHMDPQAEGLPSDTLFLQLDGLSHCLSRVLGKTSSYWKEKIMRAYHTGNRYLRIASGVSIVTLDSLRACPVFRRGRYRGGLIVELRVRRYHVFGELAFRTLGFVRPRIAVGLEGYFQPILAGEPGVVLKQALTGGRKIPIREIRAPRRGKDLVVTLDPVIQEIAHQALLEALRAHDADHGCAIVMEVATGKIRAMVNLGRVEEGTLRYGEIYNYCVGERYEPGSTFKTPAVLAVLEETGMDVHDTVTAYQGSYRFYDRIMRDHEGTDTGKIPLWKAFAQSSNVAISTLVTDVFEGKEDEWIAYLRQFGLTQKTGIPIRGEPAPLIKHPGDPSWSGTTLPWMAVGYEVQVTPLQLLTFYNGIAGNGRVMKPMLVSEVRENGRVVQRFAPQVWISQMASRASLQKLRWMLQRVVDSGTAIQIRPQLYSIAGKTGTARIAVSGKGYHREYVASFVGYFPAENPVYSCVVVIHRPRRKGFYGGTVAAPVFRKIADRVMGQYLSVSVTSLWDTRWRWERIPSSLKFWTGISSREFLLSRIQGKKRNASANLWVQFQDTLGWRTDTPATEVLPDLTGMPLMDAVYFLYQLGIEDIRTAGRMQSGVVVHHYPSAGTPLHRVGFVKLFVR